MLRRSSWECTSVWEKMEQCWTDMSWMYLWSWRSCPSHIQLMMVLNKKSLVLLNLWVFSFVWQITINNIVSDSGWGGRSSFPMVCCSRRGWGTTESNQDTAVQVMIILQSYFYLRPDQSYCSKGATGCSNIKAEALFDQRDKSLPVPALENRSEILTGATEEDDTPYTTLKIDPVYLEDRQHYVCRAVLKSARVILK